MDTSLGLIHSRGHFLKGEYCVQDASEARDPASQVGKAATVHRGVQSRRRAAGFWMKARPSRRSGETWGVTASVMRTWVIRARADRDGGKSGLTTDERAELATLRKELRLVKMERDILGKAVAFFAKENA
jgi:transposase